MEKINNQLTWISFHIYYEEPWDHFLGSTVNCFLKENEPKINKFFFIRYWENGPHVRLRLGVNNPEIIQDLTDDTLAYFNRFFEQNPSKRVKNEDSWVGNNTIQLEQYEPEVSRYGGERSMLVSQDQFQLSSKLILQLLRDKSESWNYQTALGFAVEMNLIFALATEMNMKHIYEFHKLNMVNWIQHSILKTKEYNPIRINEVVSSFSKVFNDSKDDVFKFCSEIINERKISNEYLSEWEVGMSKIHKRFKKLEANKLMSIDPSLHNYSRDLKWNIYQSLIHMNCNRLGIPNQDEAYLSYVMLRIAMNNDEKIAK